MYKLPSSRNELINTKIGGANSGKRLHPWPSDSNTSKNKNEPINEAIRAKEIKLTETVVNQLKSIWLDYK